MRTRVTIENGLPAALRGGRETVERRVTSTVHGEGRALQQEWRAQIKAAGLGQRLANTIRLIAYPEGQPSLTPASLVVTRAPRIIGAHQTGPLIRSRNGLWLAIPLPAAGTRRGARGQAETPGEWQFRNGRRLRFVPAGGRRRHALLVADDVTLNKAGVARRLKGKRRRDGIRRGEATIPIFVLLRQVQLRKRLSLLETAGPARAKLAARLRATLQGPLT